MLVEKDGTVAVVNLPEKLMGKLVNELIAAVRGAEEKGATHVAVDFKKTTFVDSSAIGSLVSLTKDFKTKGVTLFIRNLNPDITALFTETGLDLILSIENGKGLDKPRPDIFDASVDIRLDINEEERQAVCVFHLAGVMNHPVGSRFFKQQFLLAMARHKKILLDFENLTFFDSLSVSVILNMNRLLKETGGSLRICAANYIVDDLFSTLNIGQIIPLFSDVGQALENWN